MKSLFSTGLERYSWLRDFSWSVLAVRDGSPRPSGLLKSDQSLLEIGGQGYRIMKQLLWANAFFKSLTIRRAAGLPWWRSGWESAC